MSLSQARQPSAHLRGINLPIESSTRITTMVAVLDALAGHVVRRAGLGLHQIHNFSHVKVMMSPHIGPLTTRSITIRGSPHEVGDALIAVGRQIAKCHICPPCCHQANPQNPPPSGGPPSTPRPLHTPGVSTPTTSAGSTTPSIQVPSSSRASALSIHACPPQPQPIPMSSIRQPGPSMPEVLAPCTDISCTGQTRPSGSSRR